VVIIAAAVLLVLSLAMLVYVYLGYPLAVMLLAALRRRRVRAEDRPVSVTVLTAARNEAGCIAETVRNKLAADYPPELLEVIVVSDASDDGTDAILADLAAADPRVRWLRQDPREGKTAALNRASALARGEVLVFSDANSLYAPEALRRLVAPFADPEVGYVTGRMVYRAPDGSLSGEGCSAYMRYENALRRWETGVGSVVGVDGGIDAVRRECYVSMRPDQQPDFVLPLSVVEQGFRVVHAPDALLYEDALADSGDEFRMRVRVTLRAWHALRDMSALFNPARFGLYAWQLASHKALRYLAPVFQVAALVANALLVGRAPVWDVLMLLQGVFYAAALAGLATGGRGMPPLVVFPYYLCLLNSAAGLALIKFLRGERQVVWNPRT